MVLHTGADLDYVTLKIGTKKVWTIVSKLFKRRSGIMSNLETGADQEKYVGGA